MTFVNFIRAFAFAVGAATATISQAADISGAGATFPFPIYASGLILTRKTLETD
jgi:hypothetical protein